MFLDMAVSKTPSGSDFQEFYSGCFHRHNTAAMVQRTHKQKNVMWQETGAYLLKCLSVSEELFPKSPQKTSPLSHWPLLCNMPFLNQQLEEEQSCNEWGWVLLIHREKEKVAEQIRFL